jgi:hypothetical protein
MGIGAWHTDAVRSGDGELQVGGNEQPGAAGDHRAEHPKHQHIWRHSPTASTRIARDAAAAHALGQHAQHGISGNVGGGGLRLRAHGAMCSTEMNRICLVLFDMNNMIE